MRPVCRQKTSAHLVDSGLSGTDDIVSEILSKPKQARKEVLIATPAAVRVALMDKKTIKSVKQIVPLL